MAKKPVKKSLVLKVTLDEKAVFKRNAKRFNNGNVCGWLRLAATKYRPSRSELKTLAAK